MIQCYQRIVGDSKGNESFFTARTLHNFTWMMAANRVNLEMEVTLKIDIIVGKHWSPSNCCLHGRGDQCCFRYCLYFH